MVSLKINISTAAKAPNPVIKLRGDLFIRIEIIIIIEITLEMVKKETIRTETTKKEIIETGKTEITEKTDSATNVTMEII